MLNFLSFFFLLINKIYFLLLYTMNNNDTVKKKKKKLLVNFSIFYEITSIVFTLINAIFKKSIKYGMLE